jgi:signal transduction histidine kinase
MNKLDFFNNLTDAVCAFSENNEIAFKNKAFIEQFSDCITLERFKNRFNYFNLILLSSENIENKTPINILLESKENFHTVCTYQNINGEYIYYYIYTFKDDNLLFVIFHDISNANKADSIKKDYDNLKIHYDEILKSTEKFSKLQEHAQSQVLKMGIINKISLVIRETNNIETVLSSALTEIHNLLGSFKTYFSMKDKNYFKIAYSVNGNKNETGKLCEYEEEIITKIKNKNISVSSCLKEYLNSDEILSKGVKRIIIPIHNKNKLLGIIVSLTKQKINIEENTEVLESISVQLASAIIQAGLIQQLNKKNKKLNKTLTELKNAQMQLINSEKMVALGQLVSGVAHEINTPLAAISSNNMLINKILSKNDKTIEKNEVELLNELNNTDIEAAGRIRDIVKSLKRFVRLDEAEFQEADINNELDLNLKLLTSEIKNIIEIEKHYSELPPVMCSAGMLNQVFMNLLLNACHSIKEKGGAGKITISTSVNNNNLIVKIKDNGCGIPDNIQNKIFSFGFTTKKAGLGTGIGLSIAKKVVEIHKGTINFTSKVGEGTEFEISIPINNSN